MEKNNRAITLIALIITIIVLLILAGITINMVLGENGLFNKAKTSVAKYENAQKKENSVLGKYENEIDFVAKNSRDNINSEQYTQLEKQYNDFKNSVINIITEDGIEINSNNNDEYILNSIRKVHINDYTGNFYLSGTAHSSNTYSRTSYFDINVEHYNRIKINITEIFGDPSVFTSYILADGINVHNITGTGEFELDVSSNSNIRIYYYENGGYYYIKGTYKLNY